MAKRIDFPGSTISDQNRAILSEVIDGLLYPPAIYNRSLFPDLHECLTHHFLTEIRSRPARWKLFKDVGKRSAIAKLATEVLAPQRLLERHPEMIVLIHRRCIERFVAYKHHYAGERTDIVQEIIARLLERTMHKIRERFDFRHGPAPSLTSYLLVCVRNLYMDLLREAKSRDMRGTESLDSGMRCVVERGATPFETLAMEEESEKLDAILALYDRSRKKVELSLKIKFRLRITEMEALRCFPGLAAEELAVLTRDFTQTTDQQVFSIIVPVFNRHEEKTNASDSLRKWIHIKAEEIVAHLNRLHAAEVYSMDHLATLMAWHSRTFSTAIEKRGQP